MLNLFIKKILIVLKKFYIYEASIKITNSNVNNAHMPLNRQKYIIIVLEFR